MYTDPTLPPPQPDPSSQCSEQEREESMAPTPPLTASPEPIALVVAPAVTHPGAGSDLQPQQSLARGSAAPPPRPLVTSSVHGPPAPNTDPAPGPGPAPAPAPETHSSAGGLASDTNTANDTNEDTAAEADAATDADADAANEEEEEEEDDDAGHDSTASTSDAAAPTLARTYVFPTTVITPVYLKSAQDAQPTIIDVRAVIKSAHGGHLPMEFAMRRYGAGESSEDESDSDEDDGDDDDEASEAEESGSGSDADNEAEGDEDTEHDPMDVDVPGDDSPNPGPNFLAALANKYAEIERKKQDEAAAAGAGKGKKKKASAKKPVKVRKRHDWYDTQDPFIDDDGVFAGNLDLMVPVKQGFFAALGPVEVIPKKGVSEVKGSSQVIQQSSKSSATKSAATGGKGDAKSSRATSTKDAKDKGKENANPPAPKSNSSTSLGANLSTSKSSAGAGGPSSTAAGSSGTARLKYLKLPPSDEKTPRTEGNLDQIFAKSPDRISPAVASRLRAFHTDVEAADWSNKKVFPESLKNPFWDIVCQHLDETRRVPSEVFIAALFNIFPYNMFTIRKYVATRHVSQFIDEVLNVEVAQLKAELKELAKEVPAMIAKEEEKERAKQAAKAAKAAEEGKEEKDDDKPGAKRPNTRKVRLTAAMKDKLSEIVKRVVLKDMLELWKANVVNRYDGAVLLDRMQLVRTVVDLVRDFFPPGFLQNRDVSLLPVWESYTMTDGDSASEAVSSPLPPPPPPPPPATSSAAAASGPASKSSNSGTTTTAKRPRSDSAKSKSSSSTAAAADPPPRGHSPIDASSGSPPPLSATSLTPTPNPAAAPSIAPLTPATATSPGGLSTAPSSPSDVEIVGIRGSSQRPPNPPLARSTMPPLPDPLNSTSSSATAKRKHPSTTSSSAASSTGSTPTPTPTVTTPTSSFARRASVDQGTGDDAPGAKRPRLDADLRATPPTSTPAYPPPSAARSLTPAIVVPPRPTPTVTAHGSLSAPRPFLGSGVRARSEAPSPLRGNSHANAANGSEAVGVRGGSVLRGLLAAGGISGSEAEGLLTGKGEDTSRVQVNGSGAGAKDGQGMMLD